MLIVQRMLLGVVGCGWDVGRFPPSKLSAGGIQFQWPTSFAEEKGSEFEPRNRAFFLSVFFWVWETETVKEAVMPFKWLIFWYLGLVNVNAEIHSDLPELLRTIPFVQPIRCIRAAMYYSICSANGRDESFWMIGAIIHPYFRKKVQRQISWKLEFFLGGFWSRFIIYIYNKYNNIFLLWSENCCTSVVTNMAET